MCKYWEGSSDVVYLEKKSKEFGKKLDRLNKIKRDLIKRRLTIGPIRRGIKLFRCESEFNL